MTGSGAPAACSHQCSEQGKLPAAKEFKLAERDKHMSEQEQTKPGYLQELEAWSIQAVISPLLDTGPDAIAEVQKAIRAKVLESYHNGQKAGPRPAGRPWRKRA